MTELGELQNEVGVRDAFHVATVTVVCGDECLHAGEHVGIDISRYVVNSEGTSHNFRLIGIVDPFLPAPVKRGQAFLLVLYPGTAKNLKHVWEHPSFPVETESNNEDDGCRGC